VRWYSRKIAEPSNVFSMNQSPLESYCLLLKKNVAAREGPQRAPKERLGLEAPRMAKFLETVLSDALLPPRKQQAGLIIPSGHDLANLEN